MGIEGAVADPSADAIAGSRPRRANVHPVFPSARSGLDCFPLDTPLMRIRLAALPCLLVAAACADGGKTAAPQSAVKINETHHLFGFRSLAGFGSFPVRPEVVFTDRGSLNFFTNSTYSVTRSGSTSTADSYAIESNGVLSLYVTGSGREPSVVFKGGYLIPGITAASPDLFFTDRVSTPNSPSIGLYLGTKSIPGQAELAGTWHIVSLHTIFNEAILSPDNVARAAYGSVTVAAGTAGSLRTLSGTGTQGSTPSGSSTVAFTGSIQNLLGTNNQGDGSCNLTLTYGSDSRVCYAAAGNDMVLGLDADETDGEAGLIVMLRKFDDPTATPPVPVVDPARIPGTFLVGGLTMFVNPSNPGSDAFVGTVTLTSGGAFRLDGVGNQGIDFSYQGSFTVANDGHLTVTINGSNETWFAAIDRDYQTLVVLDDFRETTRNNPELNLAFGVRRHE